MSSLLSFRVFRAPGYLFLRVSLISEALLSSDFSSLFYDSIKISLSMINRLFSSIDLSHVFATIKFAAELEG